MSDSGGLEQLPQNIDVTLMALKNAGFTDEDLKIDFDGDFIKHSHLVITLDGNPPQVHSGTLAHVAKDTGVLSISLDGGDLHTFPLSVFSGMTAEDTTIEKR